MPQTNDSMTLVLIKPDALKNSLTGYVFSQLSEFHTGLRFAGMKVVHVSTLMAAEHYSEHTEKPFFPALIEYIRGETHFPKQPNRQRVIACVYDGPDAVQKIRTIAGPTNPHNARDTRPGCIRALGTIAVMKDADGRVVGDRMDNLIHASATDEEAEREIKLWFRPTEIPPAMRTYDTVVSKTHYYYKNGEIYTSYEQNSFCLFAPGDVAWKSDINALEMIVKGEKSPPTPQSVAAKYLINLEED